MRTQIMRTAATVLCIALVICVFADDAPLVPNVSLTVNNQPMGQVAASLADQSGADIFIVQYPPKLVTMSVSDIPVERALHEAAKQTGCSWIRIYVMEKPDAPLDLETLASVQKLVEFSREQSYTSLTAEEREELMGAPPNPKKSEEAVDDAEPGTEPLTADATKMPVPAGPIGSYQAWQDKMTAMWQDPAQDPEERNKEYERWMLGDPLLRLNGTQMREPVPFKAEKIDFIGFRTRVLLRSGFVIIGNPETLQGLVAMNFETASADEIVASAAEQLGCDWYRLYMVGHVKRLDDEGVKAKRQESMHEGIRKFLDMSDEERAKMLSSLEESWPKFPDEMKKAIRESPEMKAVMQEILIFSNTLSMADRAKITPILQTISKIISGKM